MKHQNFLGDFAAIAHSSGHISNYGDTPIIGASFQIGHDSAPYFSGNWKEISIAGADDYLGSICGLRIGGIHIAEGNFYWLHLEGMGQERGIFENSHFDNCLFRGLTLAAENSDFLSCYLGGFADGSKFDNCRFIHAPFIYADFDDDDITDAQTAHARAIYEALQALPAAPQLFPYLREDTKEFFGFGYGEGCLAATWGFAGQPFADDSDCEKANPDQWGTDFAPDGAPLRGTFKNCTFIGLDFARYDCSEATFEDCRFLACLNTEACRLLGQYAFN